MIVGTQSYTWHQVCAEQGKKLNDHWADVLPLVAQSGCQAIEHNSDAIGSPELAERMAALLGAHGPEIATV